MMRDKNEAMKGLASRQRRYFYGMGGTVKREHGLY